MKVLKIEMNGFPFMVCRTLKEFGDYEATIGEFLGHADDQDYLEVGTTLTVTVVEMTAEEIDALPEWEM